jgi:hypothetical protein
MASSDGLKDLENPVARGDSKIRRIFFAHAGQLEIAAPFGQPLQQRDQAPRPALSRKLLFGQVDDNVTDDAASSIHWRNRPGMRRRRRGLRSAQLATPFPPTTLNAVSMTAVLRGSIGARPRRTAGTVLIMIRTSSRSSDCECIRGRGEPGP